MANGFHRTARSGPTHTITLHCVVYGKRIPSHRAQCPNTYHYITSHYITLHSIAPRAVPQHITLHHIILHYITLHSIAPRAVPQVRRAARHTLARVPHQEGGPSRWRHSEATHDHSLARTSSARARSLARSRSTYKTAGGRRDVTWGRAARVVSRTRPL